MKMTPRPGIVYWVTGLAGAGKTTLGQALYKELKKKGTPTVFLDGDELREIFGRSSDYSLSERKTLARSYSGICRLISESGVDVVCSTISLFEEIHKFNRKNIAHYLEVYIHCDEEELIERDQKGIYSQCIEGSMKDVVGLDLTFDTPKDCDLKIDNTEKGSINDKVKMIIAASEKKFKRRKNG